MSDFQTSVFTPSRSPSANPRISRALRGATLLVAVTGTLSAFGATRELGNAWQTNRSTRTTTSTPTTTTPPTTTTTTPTTTTTTATPAPALSATTSGNPSIASGRKVPTPLYGVTIDDVSGLSDITTSLSKLAKTPTTRIVFDENVAPSYYRKPAVEISKVSYVMGEILDSYYVKTVSVPGYIDRTTQYLSALSDVVDIWEIGNEINGEWLGNNTDVVAKMTGAYDLVKSQNKTTALTLYYNQDCWSKPANEMFTWANANVPARMKQNLDYVLVSYYEADCNNLKPDWPTVFKKLAVMFPNSKIGFGEVGTATRAQKAAYLTRYYSMKINEPNYVGGHFWWYARQDVVPYTKALWSTLNSAITAP